MPKYNRAVTNTTPIAAKNESSDLVVIGVFVAPLPVISLRFVFLAAVNTITLVPPG
jgi:hypothetical protein